MIIKTFEVQAVDPKDGSEYLVNVEAANVEDARRLIGDQFIAGRIRLAHLREAGDPVVLDQMNAANRRLDMIQTQLTGVLKSRAVSSPYSVVTVSIVLGAFLWNVIVFMGRFV